MLDRTEQEEEYYYDWQYNEDQSEELYQVMLAEKRKRDISARIESPREERLRRRRDSHPEPTITQTAPPVPPKPSVQPTLLPQLPNI